MAGRRRESSTHVNRKRCHDRDEKARCTICGRSLDIYHDPKPCMEAWLKKLDAEGNPSNTRNTSK